MLLRLVSDTVVLRQMGRSFELGTGQKIFVRRPPSRPHEKVWIFARRILASVA